MITPEKAQELAQQKMQEYIDACECDNLEDVGNVLTKMVGMCGVAMCATIGLREAVDRLEGTAEHLTETQVDIRWNANLVN